MPVFSDPLLVQILMKAAKRVNRRLCLFGTDNEITLDATGEFLNPTDSGALEDIVLLQAECMLAQREYQSELRSSSGGVFIKDGEQSVDTRSAGIARGTFFANEHNPCEEVKTAIRDMKLDMASGKMVW